MRRMLDEKELRSQKEDNDVLRTVNVNAIAFLEFYRA